MGSLLDGYVCKIQRLLEKYHVPCQVRSPEAEFLRPSLFATQKSQVNIKLTYICAIACIISLLLIYLYHTTDKQLGCISLKLKCCAVVKQQNKPLKTNRGHKVSFVFLQQPKAPWLDFSS